MTDRAGGICWEMGWRPGFGNQGRKRTKCQYLQGLPSVLISGETRHGLDCIDHVQNTGVVRAYRNAGHGFIRTAALFLREAEHATTNSFKMDFMLLREYMYRLANTTSVN
jgi:hypothetical protein